MVNFLWPKPRTLQAGRTVFIIVILPSFLIHGPSSKFRNNARLANVSEGRMLARVFSELPSCRVRVGNTFSAFLPRALRYLPNYVGLHFCQLLPELSEHASSSVTQPCSQLAGNWVNFRRPYFSLECILSSLTSSVYPRPSTSLAEPPSAFSSFYCPQFLSTNWTWPTLHAGSDMLLRFCIRQFSY